MQNQTRAKQDLYDVEPIAQIDDRTPLGCATNFHPKALEAQSVDSHLGTSQTIVEALVNQWVLEALVK